jgi:hypothetical protein
VRGALVVLQHGTDDAAKSRAVKTILNALDENKPTHPELIHPDKSPS